MNDNAVLCYVDEPWAYFTTCPLEDQWGDDWNDMPYWDNAGPPRKWAEYLDTPKYEVFRVAFDGDLEDPGCFYVHHEMSVEDINAGHYPWLQTPRHINGPLIKIWAGTTFVEFKKLIKQAGGTVYVPITE